MNQSFCLHTFPPSCILNELAAIRRVTMSKFFTYEERLTLQKHLKESLSFKEITRRLNKNPTTISREVRKHLSEVATGYPGF
nr:helix-turn-helix domain-containing protein [Clostridium sp. N3C]